MKKRKLIIAGIMAATLAFAITGCGEKKEAKKTEANVEDASASDAEKSEDNFKEISADDPEVKAMMDIKVPEKPSLDKMGEIKLPELSDITVKVPAKTEVTDDMVEENIKYILSSNPESLETAAIEGDTVNIDYTGTIDGEKFDGGSAEGSDLTLGSGAFIPGFEDQLIGHKKGDEVDVKVTFPRNYGAKELAGKDAVFAVKVNEVKRNPELTDEFVKTVSKHSTNVAEYKAEMKSEIEKYMDYTYKNTVMQAAISEITEKSEVEPSKELLDYANDDMISGYVNQFAQMGMNIADVLNMQKMSLADFKEEIKTQSELSAKNTFIVEALESKLGVMEDEDVIDKFVKNVKENLGEDITREKLVLQIGGEDKLLDVARYEELTNLINEKVNVEIESPEDAAAEAPKA